MVQTFTSMKELPDSEKPYEKFLESGAEALSDAELLAVIIRSGTQGKKSIEVAQDFLAQGSRNLLNLYEISFDEMKSIHGIGQVKAIQLKCVAELSKRIAKTRYQDKLSMNHPQTIADYYMERMRHEKQERLLALFFDNRCRLLSDVTMSIGSITTTFVSPREIFLAALRCNAVQIILLHNHPSGNTEPSADDDTVTKRIEECGVLLGIPLIDHIILGDQSYYSYREHKRIIY
ncbi:MAG: DNA repair protein RadC [Clostridiales bacterium]|nr:DNA repair protein RadC [Roseburia sp.]MDD7638207.1 DNA repair protein RadC [Clostridiales bacterium]MDY4114015.1 DNA repair protein RadC [Roseburia sp.]